MNSLALVIPPYKNYTNYWLPFAGLGYLTSELLKKGYHPVIIDSVAEGLSFDELLLRLVELKPIALLLPSTTSEVSDAHRVALAFKDFFPQTPIIVGGAHCSMALRETLERCRGFDVAVASEGEQVILKVLDAVLGNNNLYAIRGIAFRKTSRIVVTKPREYLQNLDALPFPHWPSFPIKGYRGLFSLFSGLEYPVMAFRGCPYKCIFCQRSMGTQVRGRSITNVVAEIEHAIACGAKSIEFNDETFTLQRQWVVSFCKELIHRGLNHKCSWHCTTRADLIDAELLAFMMKAGCRVVIYGAESFNNDILKAAKKDLTAAQIIKAIRLTKDAGMDVFLCLIFGLPYDTKSLIRSTISTLLSLPVDYVTITILVPFPGTEVQRMVTQGEGGLKPHSKEWNNYAIQKGGAIELKQASHRELRLLQLYAYIRFYLRPTRILNLFKLVNPLAALREVIGVFKHG